MRDDGGEDAPFGDLPEEFAADDERKAIVAEGSAMEAPQVGIFDQPDPPIAPAPPPALSPLDVVDQWKTEGPLVHEPTGIAKLDELTGGGPVYGSRWYWLGAPDAGKTAELVQIADHWSHDGRVVVGYLAVDEEPSDITTRLAQRRKFRRDECEGRAADVLAEMKTALAESQLRLYGPEWTIDSAATDLAAYAAKLGKADRVALFVDSIQQVTCGALASPDREVSPREVVSANVRALRSVATQHRLIAMATSEMNRNAYRSIEAAEQSNDMAAGKESGAIEFSARVMLSLRSVKGEKDMSVLRVVKNKHGPSGDEIHRRIDRRHMTIETTEAPAPSEAKSEGKHADHLQAAARLADFLADHQGVGTKKLRAGLRKQWGAWPTDLVDVAGACLESAFVEVAGAVGKAKAHYIDGSKLPEEVVAALQPERRPAVLCARPVLKKAGASDD